MYFVSTRTSLPLYIGFIAPAPLAAGTAATGSLMDVAAVEALWRSLRLLMHQLLPPVSPRLCSIFSSRLFSYCVCWNALEAHYQRPTRAGPRSEALIAALPSLDLNLYDNDWPRCAIFFNGVICEE